MRWQPEQREQRVGRQEERQLADLPVTQLEHLYRPRLVTPVGVWLVLPDGWGAVGADRRDDPRVLAADAGTEPPGEDVVASGQPQVVRRHRLGRVLVDQLRQRVDVVG